MWRASQEKELTAVYQVFCSNTPGALKIVQEREPELQVRDQNETALVL